MGNGEGQTFSLTAHRPGSQYPHWVTHPERVQCRLRGSFGSDGVLLLKLLTNLPRRGLLPLEELLGIHCHAFTLRKGSPLPRGSPLKRIW